MDIRGPEGIGKTPGVGRIKKAADAYKTSETSSTRQPDAVQLSEKAQLLSKLSQTPEVRWDKILEVRRQIEAGTYDSPEKLDKAIQKLLEEFGGK
jgi:negative regulator of flagellin synthesis FlgM